MSLRNEDYTDRELLAVIERHEPATAGDIAQQLSHSKQEVVTRLSWMRRYGFLDSVVDDGKEVQWVLTEAGHELVRGKLNQTMSRQLSGMGAGSKLLAMRRLMEAGYVDERQVFATALRREYLHQAARRQR